MSNNMLEYHADLRLRALQRLTGADAAHDARLNASAAFRVLHDLASSPETSAAALALLHELQVHQVELDVQDEELRRSRVELEARLTRQIQLYDSAPAGFITVDRNLVLRELNLTAARILGAERDQLFGRSLDSFLAPRSADTLRAMLAGVSNGAATKADALRLVARRGAPQRVHASVNRDPDGQHFLIAMVDAVDEGTETRS